MKFGFLLLATILISVAAQGQPTAARSEFEVASVKPSDPAAKRGPMYFKNLAGDWTVQGNSLKEIIAFAYQIPESRLSGGPRWIETERFDIEAKVERTASVEGTPGPNEMTEDQRRARDRRNHERICTLLAARFGLVAHLETRDLPVFELSVMGTGPKLKQVEKIGDKEGTGGGRGRTQGFSVPIESLAAALSEVAGRPVIDKTGLTGRFDWLLEWTPEPASTVPDGTNAAQVPDLTYTGLFTALRDQLGMRLQPSHGPVETLVIDQATRLLAN